MIFTSTTKTKLMIKPKTKPGLLAFAGLLCAALAHGQFVLPGGSDGSMGALNVTANTTLTVPPDGVFHYTTININAGTTLSFTRNSNNTPVYLFATGDITIAGTINLDGADSSGTSYTPGGPGGGDGGYATIGGGTGGAGGGPGGGKPGLGNVTGTLEPGTAGVGVFSTIGSGISTNRTSVYGGPLLRPLVGGSGGGATYSTELRSGGGGGGAIRVGSSTRITFTGNILARGGDSAPGAGSGGSVHLVAPLVTGNGTMNVDGGAIYRSGFGQTLGSAGRGRTRVDTFDRRTLSISGVDSIGSHVVGLESPPPRLDIVEVAGNGVPLGSPEPVQVILPTNAPSSQIIRVRAAGLNAMVPLELQLRPWDGLPIKYTNVIDNLSQDPAFVDVSVTIPPNILFNVEAWKR